MATSYLAGELAGAQAVLHGKRLCHVGHRLVELLQVTLVLHLHVDEPDTGFQRKHILEWGFSDASSFFMHYYD